MSRAAASLRYRDVSAAEAEALWYDPARWPSWVDGFGKVAKLEGPWPEAGAVLAWDSPPNGRGRVLEEVVAYEPRVGQTLRVEDERLRGEQRVRFTPHPDGVEITLSLEYELKEAGPLRRVADLLFIRRAVGDSLRRTLSRLGAELAADRDLLR